MDVFALYATINIDSSDYERGLDDASSKTSSFGDKVKSGLATVGKVLITSVGAATTAVTALMQSSLDGYANYEQLVGGVETLFKTSSGTIMEYANNAYKTAGLSANEYMETVTSFSASLLQSLGGDTEAAAQYADLAITDMSDNANKMGSSMESIQNAYQGFAKQNYTMLDNLKLGYGGTKEEMERLIADANRVKEANGEMADLSIDSFADVTEAIHIIQTEMEISGISAEEAAELVASGAMTQEEAFARMGTTAKEASTTIQGSVSSMKSAWSNLVTGIADENANFEVLVGNLVDSIFTVMDNVVPRIQQIMEGLGTAIETVAPVIMEKLPEVINSLLPMLIETGGKLLQAIMDGIISVLPSLSNAALQIVLMLGSFIVENLPTLVDAGLQIITTLAMGIANALPELIPTIVTVIMQIVQTLTSPSAIGNLINAAIQIIMGLIQGLVNAVPILVAYAPQIITNIIQGIINALPQMLIAGLDIIIALGEGLIKAIPELIKAIPKIFQAVIDGIKDFFTNGIGKIWDWITGKSKESGNEVEQTMENTWSSVKNSTQQHLGETESYIDGVYNGLNTNTTNTFGDIGNTIDTTWGAAGVSTQVNWDAIYGTTSNKTDSIVSAVSTGFSLMSRAVNTEMTAANDASTVNWENILATSTYTTDSIYNTTADSYAGVFNVMDSELTSASDTNQTKWNEIANLIAIKTVEALTAVANSFGKMESTVVDGIVRAKEGSNAQDWYSVGTNIVDGMSYGVNARARELAWSVANAASNALSAAKSALGIASPSKKFRDIIGMNIGEGIAVGVDQSRKTVLDSIYKMSDSVQDAFDSSMPQLEYTSSITSAASLGLNVASRTATGIDGTGRNNVATVAPETPVIIQLVLDNKVIKELATSLKNRERAYGTL